MIQAFAVYYLLLLLLVLTWRFAAVPAGQPSSMAGRQHALLAAVSVLLYGLVLGLRDNVGGDYLAYVDYYLLTTWRVAREDVPFEVGFYWLIRALKAFDLPPAALFVATCAIQMAFMAAWLRRHPFLAPWFIYFYFTTLLVFEAMNTIRQALAFMILLSAVPAMIDRRLLRYVLLVLLASTMHTSALVFLPLYFVLDRDWITSARSQIAILAAVYLGAVAIKDYLFTLLPLITFGLGYEGYSGVREDLFFEREVTGFGAGLAFVLAVDVVVALASPWLRQRYAPWGFRAYYNAYWIGALLTPVIVFANYIPFARLAFYFSSFRFVVLAFLVAGLLTRPGPGAKALATVLLVAYFGWFSSAIAKGAAWCAPFQFVFQ